MSAPPRRSILISAVEPSADALGAAFMQAMRDNDPDIEFFGCGGAAMRAAGLEPIVDPSRLAVIGPIAAVSAAARAAEAANALSQAAFERRADAGVLIDSWSFSAMLAARLQKISPSTRRYKYVAPQVFASRPGRAKTAARLFDGLMTLFDFETDNFERAGLKTVCVGNSTLQRIARADKDPAGFRDRHRLADAPVLLIMPGSRSGELSYLDAPFSDCAARLMQCVPGLKIVIVAATAVADDVRRRAARWPAPVLVVPEAEKLDAFAAATAALAASGTVSSELALCGVPMVIAYRAHAVTAAIVRRIVTVDYLSLINIASGKAIVPERLQEDCTGSKLAAALTPLLTDEAARNAQQEAFPAALDALGLGDEDAGGKAARTVLGWLGDKN